MNNTYNEYIKEFNDARNYELNKVLNQINNKYNEDFKVFRIITTIGTNETELVLYKKNDPEVRFSVFCNGKDIYADNFIIYKCIKDLKKYIIGDDDSICASISYVSDKKIEENKDISLDELITFHCPRHIIVRIIINSDDGISDTNIYNRIKEFSSMCNFRVFCEYYKMNSHDFNECKKILYNNPTVSRKTIEKCNVLDNKNMFFEKGKCSVDIKDFINFMGG